jgi:hypothetical protein
MPIHGNPPARIAISEIAAEFGGSTPHRLSEYYRGGSLVLNSPLNGNISTSGSPIRLSQFYGASKFFLKAKFSATSETFQEARDGCGNVTSSNENNDATVTVTIDGTSNNFEVRSLIDGAVFKSVNTINLTPNTIGNMDNASTAVILIIDKGTNNAFKFTFNPGYNTEASVITRNGSVVTQGVWFDLPIGSTDVPFPILARDSIVSEDGYCYTKNDGIGGTYSYIPPDGEVFVDYGCYNCNSFWDDNTGVEMIYCECSGLCYSGCGSTPCNFATSSPAPIRDYPSG